MAKTLNELANELKDLIIDLQSDAHNKGSLRPERYNNLKILMDVAANPTPNFDIFIGMSSAEFGLRTGDKLKGSLGPDEKYVIRWLAKPGVLEDLRQCWMAKEKQRGKAYVDEDEH